MVTDPLRFSQGAGLYVERTRYSCDCRGLMRGKELSALINSVSTLIFQAGNGWAQMPKTPEYSLMKVSPVSSSMGCGVLNVNEPSPLAVQPSGSAPFSRAQSPRLALSGKTTSETASKSLSLIERWR